MSKRPQEAVTNPALEAGMNLPQEAVTKSPLEAGTNPALELSSNPPCPPNAGGDITKSAAWKLEQLGATVEEIKKSPTWEFGKQLAAIADELNVSICI